MSASSFSRSFTASSIVAMISLLGSVLEVIEKLRPFASRKWVSIWVNCLEDILITHFFLCYISGALSSKVSLNNKVSLIIQSSSITTRETEIQYVQQEIKKQVAKLAKHYDNIPSKLKLDIGSLPSSMGLKQILIVFQKFI